MRVLGNIHVQLVTLGATASLLLAIWRGRQVAGIWRGSAIMLANIVIAVMFGHLLWLLADADWATTSFADVLSLWKGLRAPGMIVGVVLGLVVVCPLAGVSVWRFADALAPAAGLGVAAGRLGCWLNGCCLPVAPWYCGVGLAIAVGTVGAGGRLVGPPGGRAMLALGIYGASTIILEWFRPAQRWIVHMPVLSMVGVSIVMMSLLGMCFVRRLDVGNRPVEPSSSVASMGE